MFLRAIDERAEFRIGRTRFFLPKFPALKRDGFVRDMGSGYRERGGGFD